MIYRKAPVGALVLVALLAAVACSSGGASAPDDAGALLIPVASPSPGGPVEIVVWSSKPLPEHLAPVAQDLRGVLGVGSVGRGTLDLRSVQGGTRALSPRPADAVIPISVTALDPKVVGAFPGLEEIAELLASGQAVVPGPSALFRGIDVGAQLQLAGDGQSLVVRVGAIADEGRMFPSEVIVSTKTGGSLGIGAEDVVVIAAEPQAAAEIEREIERALGDFPARVRSGSSSSSGARSGARLLSLLELKETFGEFWYRPVAGSRIAIDPVWVDSNIIRARVPLLGEVTCNRAVIPQLTEAMLEITNRGLADRIHSYDGCFSPRMQVSDSHAISRHAYGVAVDINAATNGYGETPTLDSQIVSVMQRWGFSWGGRWPVPDGMHFEFVRFPS